MGRRRPGSKCRGRASESLRWCGPRLAAEGANTIQFLSPVGSTAFQRILRRRLRQTVYERFRQRTHWPSTSIRPKQRAGAGCRAGAVDSSGSFPSIQASSSTAGPPGPYFNEGRSRVDWHPVGGRVTVWVVGLRHIDRPPPVVSGEPGRPRSEQVKSALDALDVSQC